MTGARVASRLPCMVAGDPCARSTIKITLTFVIVRTPRTGLDGSIYRRGRALPVSLGELRIFEFPLHGHIDAVITAGVIEENDLLPISRLHFSIFRQAKYGLGKPIGLARGIESEDVGFDLVDPNNAVGYRRDEKQVNREQGEHEG